MNELLSCDTMVALGNSTKSGNVIFAKNSDRPLGESQPLCLFEAKDYPDQELLSCTYISIPQVSRTYKVLGSKPYWIWGFEHGMNEWGVAIGNEAVWPREEEERENGLLGMDLVRLGLERSKTAYAMSGTLLSSSGQDCMSAPAGYPEDAVRFWRNIKSGRLLIGFLLECNQVVRTALHSGQPVLDEFLTPLLFQPQKLQLFPEK